MPIRVVADYASSSSSTSSNLKDPEGAAYLSNKSEGIRRKLGDGEARFASIAFSLRSLLLKKYERLPAGRQARARASTNKAGPEGVARLSKKSEFRSHKEEEDEHERLPAGRQANSEKAETLVLPYRGET